MAISRGNVAFKHMGSVPAFSLLIMLSACAQTAAATPAAISPRQRTELIQRLETAKQSDWKDAVDSKNDSVVEDDFLDQMNKADRAIRELSNGFGVSQSEIDDALWVPPKSISPEQRADLIRQLKDAVQQDDRNEQAMMNDIAWANSDAPVDTVTFERKKAFADNVLEELEIGEEVHWSEIKEALQVAKSPY